jgi:hypothetical protein
VHYAERRSDIRNRVFPAPRALHTLKMKFLALALFLSLAPLAHADVPGTPAAEEGTPAPLTPEQKAEQLSTIQRDIQWLEQSVAAKKKELAGLTGEDASEAREELESLQLRLERARVSFVATASDVELPAPEDNRKKPPKRDLIQEAQQLIEPLFDALKRVSEKPRKIEAMRTRLAELTNRRELLDKALAGLQANGNTPAFQGFATSFQDTATELSHQRDELTVRIDMLNRALHAEVGNPVSVLQFVRGELSDFFATRGRNFFLALLVFGGVLWGLMFLKKYTLRSRLSHHTLRGLHKPITTLYGIVALFFAIFASVMTLHFLNDWFMATLVMLVFFGLLWTMRSVLQHFVHEVKLALNLGTVKEGERIIWNGVPWRIQTLGFRSVLQNDDLQGGRITVPANALNNILSREPYPGEPWFPTQVGDFVQLNDGTSGIVELQTPGTVIVNSSGSRKHYATADFLNQNPQNLSRGFELTTELRVNHKGANPDAAGVAAAVAKHLGQKYPHRFSPAPSPKVRVVRTGEESLRVWVQLDCPGELAADRDAVRWEMKVAGSGALLGP